MILYTQLNNALAQQSNIPRAVNKFWKTVNDYAIRYNGETNFTKNYSSDEIETLTKKYYRVISDNPIGLNMKLHIEYEKWDSLAGKFHGMPNGLKPATKCT